MEILDSEKRRARNLIWNAAADYSFEPDFKAYDEDGRADLYWNSIIGAVRKNYGAETIEGLFESLHGCSKEQLFEQLLWLGLENAVYQREASLRRSYARRAVALDQRADPGDLLATLENAHFCRALGQSEPPLLPRDREMLDALEFPGDLDGPAIAERALAFLHTYFHFTPGETQAQESEERKRRRPLFAFRRRSEADLLPAVRAFGHGFGEHLVKGQGGGANAEPVQRRLTDYNLAQTEAALRKYMRGYFGAPLYDQSQLESLERELCVDEHQGCHLYYATGDDTHEKLKGYVAAQRRNALRQMELNRAAYEADATRHRTSIRRLTARKGNLHRRMKPDAHGHRLRTAVGEHHLLLQSLGRKAESDLAFELVRKVAENRVVSGVRIVAALHQHLLPDLPSLRHGERLALEDAVVVMVLFGVRYGKAVSPAAERITPVLDPVGRKQDRQSEDMRPSLERFDLVVGRCPQNLGAQPRIGQPDEVCAHARNQQGRIVAFRELDGPHPMPVGTAEHFRAVFRSSPRVRPSTRRPPACRPARRP